MKIESYSSEDSKKEKEEKEPEELSTKLEGLMETYLWKYMDKLDGTIETASEKIM